LLVGESFDDVGRKVPVGHTTIYLDRVCADGPLKLRMCVPGEPAGVAISRYKNIGTYDWLASPIMQFLYAKDNAGDALQFATPEAVAGLREAYRRRFLSDIFPDPGKQTNQDLEWWESAGMAYNRRFWGYEIATTREQDERFVAAMNLRPNRHAYRTYTANCANFAADLINMYFRGMVQMDRTADLGSMLPKQVARCVARFGAAHPEEHLRVIEILQVPGTTRRSWKVRGGAEAFVKTPRYIVPMVLVQPQFAAMLGLMYAAHGRWELGQGAVIEGPDAFQRTAGPGEDVATIR
jgi:hypothetical protein